MRQRLMDFMRGRNGTDQLSMCMMWAACILVFIDMFCVLQKYWQASG